MYSVPPCDLAPVFTGYGFGIFPFVATARVLPRSLYVFVTLYSVSVSFRLPLIILSSV